MYIPAWFREDTPAVCHDLIRAHPFAALVTNGSDAPFATHLPFLLDADRGEMGVLRAHLAKANPQWQAFASDSEALVIFQGPHAYISPTWYESHPNVPTWNYAVVHVYGRPRLLNEKELYALLIESIHTFEPENAVDYAEAIDENYLRKLMNGIVGFEIAITRLEGKWKMSQNKADADRTGVIKRLSASENHEEQQVARMMQQTEDK